MRHSKINLESKRRVIPVTGNGGQYVCVTLMNPHFLENLLTDGGGGCVNPRAIGRLEGLDNLKNFNDIAIQTRDLPACSIVTQ
jgi:hypothetical protein